jgi:hypothetical protein
MYVYLKFQDNDLKDDFIDVELKKTSDNFDGTTNIISVPHF